MTQVMLVKVSAPFKEAAATYAATRNKTLSELVREVVAEAIGYDLTVDGDVESRGRPRKYASDDARKSAASKRAQERAERQRLVVAAIMKQERLDGAAALEKWLEDHNISVDLDSDTTAA